MRPAARLRRAGLLAIPAAVLVALALVLAVPAPALDPAGPSSTTYTETVAEPARPVRVPYTETEVEPVVSRAYSATTSVENRRAQLVSEISPVDAAQRGAGAAEGLSVARFGLPDGARETADSVAWRGEDVFYLSAGRDLYANMFDASANAVTSWNVEDASYRPFSHPGILRAPYGGPVYYSGIASPSGPYYFSVAFPSWSDGFNTIFMLDPDTGSLDIWNEKNLFSVGPRMFADAQDNLYFGTPSGVPEDGYTEGDAVPEDEPLVVLGSMTGSDRLGVEFVTVSVGVYSADGRAYATLTAPDGEFLIKDDYLLSLTDERMFSRGSMPGTLGEYTATAHNRFGTATASITLTEEQKVVQNSSSQPGQGGPSYEFVLANKLDPDTNRLDVFYRQGDDLPHMRLLDVDESGTMYFGVSHGAPGHYATGVARFDQSSGTITTWPNLQCIITHLAVSGDKIYCQTHSSMAELDTSSNTLRQWHNAGSNPHPSAMSADADSDGAVFTNREDLGLVRFVPSTGAFTALGLEHVERVAVDASGALRAVQLGDRDSMYALTVG